MMQVPVLYTDLDDTVRKGPDTIPGKYVNKPSDVDIFPGVRAKLLAYKKAGWRIVAVTNQGGISLGHVSEDDVLACLDRTNHLCGGAFDLMIHCPHHPEARDPSMRKCLCRKPLTGMLYKAITQLIMRHGKYEAFPFNLALFVGDMLTDEQCAKTAKIKFIFAKDWRKSDGIIT